MPVVIEEFEIVQPSPESVAATTPGGAGAASAQAPVWSAELARRLQDQLRLAIERQQRLLAD